MTFLRSFRVFVQYTKDAEKGGYRCSKWVYVQTEDIISAAVEALKAPEFQGPAANARATALEEL